MLRVRPMTRDDIPLGMRLKEQAGWNQTEADWRRFLDLEPAGCFLAEWDGSPVGTTTTCIFGSIAWIAMVLVDKEYRGRGIATALMSHAVKFLESQRVRTIRLDATPLGTRIYERLGFVTEYRLIRYEGSAGASIPVGLDVSPVEPIDWENVLRVDRASTGTDRRKLLERILAECSETFLVARNGRELIGYISGRPGKKAFQIGPCLATLEAGPQLVSAVLQQQAGKRVFIDIPQANIPAIQFIIEKVGLKVQRHLWRMRRGVPVMEKTENIWASSGPEKG